MKSRRDRRTALTLLVLADDDTEEEKLATKGEYHDSNQAQDENQIYIP